MFDISYERDQLIAAWKSAVSSGWMSEPKAPVRALIDPDRKAFGMSFRHSHNIFGWKAGDTLAKRGLCSGAIYRTEQFMKTPQPERCGDAGSGRTVHIEHTVPIATINTAWMKARSERVPALAEAYAWMFVHSLTTAVHADEMGGIRGYERKTDALDPSSSWFDRPFMRYRLKQNVPVIWNVLTGEKVDEASFSFEDHFKTIGMLLEKAGADPKDAATIRREGELVLRFFKTGNVLVA